MFKQGKIMKKRLLTALIVLTGTFLIYTSIVYACDAHKGQSLSYYQAFDPAKENVWSMKIKISGSTESIMNIMLVDWTLVKDNPKGFRQVSVISMIEPKNQTLCMLSIDDSKDPVTYTLYTEERRIKRHNKTEFENNKYENTVLTLKEIIDTAVKLIDRDQVTVNGNTVTVMERNIGIEEFNRNKGLRNGPFL
jgi:hypothetical protein